MAKTNHITNSFVAGEVSPRFFGRTDTQQYNSAAEKLFNSLVYPQGGSGRRPGTKFVMSVLNPMNQPPGQVRLIPFHGSDGTRWQLVITCEPPQSAADSSDPSYGSVDYYDVGNWSWKAINVETEEVYAIKNNFGQFSGANTTFTDYYDYESDGVDLNTLQYAQNNDTLFIVDGVHRPLILIYDPALLNTGVTPNLDNGVFSLYEWPRYQFPISNPDYPSQEVATYRQMPFLDAVNDSSTDQINLAASGGGVLTISSSGLFDEETWIGRVIRFTRGADACVVVVTAVTDVNNASVSLIAGTAPANGTNKNYGGNTTDYYEEGAWNDEYGWPRTVCFFEQRLVFGGTATFPDTIWFSRVGNIDIIDNIGLVDDSDFLDAIANTDEFKTTLKGNLLNEIRWMFDSKNITAGTNYREYVVQGPSTAKTIGPDNVQTQGETPHGSAQVQAVRIENTTVFVQRHRRAVRELVYNLDENSFKAPNLSIISAHMPVKAAEEKLGDWRHKARGYFVAMAMQEVPLGILWCLDNNGRLSGMTRERQQEVNAWHQHELGGASFIKTVEGDVSMKPFIHSISAIQRPQSTTYEDGPTGEPDELWVAVARGYKEPGSTDYEEGPVMYIEKFMDEWEDPTIEDGWITDANPKRAPVYMDCAIITDSDQVTTPGVIEDLPHAEGEIVDVVCNGHHFGEYTVEDGSVDISEKLSDLGIIGSWQAIVGYNYDSDIVPVVPEVQATTGSSQGLPRRIDQITIHFLRTIGAKFGRYADAEQDNTPYAEMEEIEFRRSGAAADDPIPMFTGEKTLVFPPGYEKRPKVHIRSSIPLPMQVTHIVSRMVVHEG